ncbi:MAG TPA: IucA/IucC family protein, partial [Micromonosporaceae bacterium]
LSRELTDCVANLELSRTATTNTPMLLKDLAGRPDALSYLEQSIIDGHPLHPLCRTRMGMSAADIRRYAPEFRTVVELPIVDVPPERWLSTGAGLPPRLPMHPWQAERYDLPVSGRTIRARPLMSLRTLELADEPGWHLKTSIDVQMTSAERTVSPAAVHNGPAMSRLLRKVARGEPLEVMDEFAAGAMLVDGRPSRHFAVVRRRAPALGPGEIAVPLAVLSARSPATGRPFLSECADDVGAFVTDLLTLLLPPLLRLLGRGVALEAHGQNTLVILRDLRPVRLAYRDMGGVRVSPRRLAAAGIEAPRLLGDLITDDPAVLRTKLTAAVISTVTAQLIDTAGDPGLWRTVAGILRAIPGDAHQRADVATILEGTLPMKAMTAMRLAAEPLEDIWTAVPSPMADL